MLERPSVIRPDVYCSIAGGGPAITYLAGGAAAVDARSRVLGWAGASAGSIVAACKAFGVGDEVIREIITSVLASGKALDFGVENIPRGGLFDLDIIGDLLDLHIGRGAKLGDATTALVVGVTDLDKGCPLMLTKQRHPKVLVREAVIASSSFMCSVVPAAQIPSMALGEHTPGIKLYGDGGLSHNTVDDVWDHKPEPRVSLALAPQDAGTRLRPGDIPGILAAIPRALLWAAGQRRSMRHGLDVDIDGANDWAFTKSPARCATEWAQGYDSAARHSPWFLGVANPTGSL